MRLAVQFFNAFLLMLYNLISEVSPKDPNNSRCFKNSDCMSGCCISKNGAIGLCVARPQIGQICGLFRSNYGEQNMYGSMNNMQSNFDPWQYSSHMSGLRSSQFAPAYPAVAFGQTSLPPFGLAHGPPAATRYYSDPAFAAIRPYVKPKPKGRKMPNEKGKESFVRPPSRVPVLQKNHYPQDARILAYQQAGGYGSFGLNTNYYGFGKKRDDKRKLFKSSEII